MSEKRPPEPLSIKRNTLFNTVGSVFYQGCLWLITVFVVVFSDGFYDSGALAFAMSIANIFNPIATYSMRIFQVSDINGKYTQQNYIGFRITTIAVGYAFIIPYTLIVTLDPSSIIASIIFLFFKTDEAFCDVLYGIDQQGMRMDYIGISQLLRGILIAVLFPLFLIMGAGLFVAIASMFAACLCVTVLYDIPHASRFGNIHPSIARKQMMLLFRECLPVVIATLFISMVVSIPRQYYGIARGIDLLGVYAAIATPAVLVQACARYFYSPALVPLAIKWSEDDGQSEFRRFFIRTELILVICVIAMIVALSLLGAPCLTLVYGQKIESFTFLFPYVLIGTGLIAVEWFLTDTLVIIRDMRGLLMTNAIAAGISIISMVPLISLFDMNGINYSIITSIACSIAFATARIHIAVQKKAIRPASTDRMGER